jgi:uncharacterized protein
MLDGMVEQEQPMTAVREQALNWRCGDDDQIGIISKSATSASQSLGVLIVVGGPQYRAGSHRQFVQLARHLAGAGFATLRFDVRGMGDSEGQTRHFEQLDDDIASALGAFQTACPHIQRIVLWGLCDAASASLLYLYRQRDPRIAGLSLLNPWVRSVQSLARTRVKHYYLNRLISRDFWRKVVLGGVGLSALTDLARNIGHATHGGQKTDGKSFQDCMLAGWSACGLPTLLMLSEKDYTAQEFVEFSSGKPRWQSLLNSDKVSIVRLIGADHTCSIPGTQEAAEAATLKWLRAQLA